MAEKPLMLKDYLELDSHYDSFQCSTIRYLLHTELNHANLYKPHSKSPVSKLTTFMQAFSSRSLSKRLRRSLAGRKRSTGDENKTAMTHNKDFKVKDIMRLSSFNNGGREGLINSCSPECPSPIVSSCSSGNTSGRSSISRSSSSSGSEFLISSVDNFTDVNSKQGSPPATVGPGARVNNMDLERKEMDKQECCFHSSEDESEKEQLSPVSVMDFPYDQDEEEESTSYDFQQSLANIEMSKHQLLQKIRRFECIAELEPLDLDPLFEDEQVANEDDEVLTRALELVKQLKDISVTTVNDNIEKILLDFFTDGICSMRNDVISNNDHYQKKEQLLLKEGINWLNQVEYSVGEYDLSVAYLKEMEKNGRWRCFKDDETEVGMDLELDVMESLLDELVLDLLA
ncbi:hypothetical protein DsansV1_C08g0079101 [Dioscorea sansibarensis]